MRAHYDQEKTVKTCSEALLFLMENVKHYKVITNYSP